MLPEDVVELFGAEDERLAEHFERIHTARLAVLYQAYAAKRARAYTSANKKLLSTQGEHRSSGPCPSALSAAHLA